MKDWLVVLKDRSELEALQAVVPVEWDSQYTRVVSIRATDAVADRVRRLSGVLSVTEPQVGHVMV